MKGRTNIRRNTIEKRLGVGGELLPPENKAIIPIRVREKIYMITTEYSNDEIRKMSEDDFVYLKSKFYNTIYRNEFVKKGKPRTKRIASPLVLLSKHLPKLCEMELKATSRTTRRCFFIVDKEKNITHRKQKGQKCAIFVIPCYYELNTLCEI